LRISRAKAFEPVTLVRSPTFTNSEPLPIKTGSSPDSRMGGGAGRDAEEEAEAVVFMANQIDKGATAHPWS